MGTSTLDRDPFEELAEEFAERLRRGEHPPLTEFIARCPDRADDIRELFPALAMVERFKPSAAGPAIPVPEAGRSAPVGLPERLGDYRIIRYLGEGGMGVVYEAVRESLRSHVALKVMHPQYRNRESYLRRFRREARSAARLHHTNIVSVFDYGLHDGVCYYAMQYIAGHSLDRIIADIRQLRRENETSPAVPGTVARVADGEHPPRGGNGSPAASHRPTDSLRQTIILGLLTGRFATAPPAPDSGDGGPSLSETTPPLASSRAVADPIAVFAAGLAVGEATTIAPGDELTEAVPGSIGRGEGAEPNGMTASRERPPDAPEPGGPGGAISEGSVSTLTGRSDDRYYREVARLGVQIAEALEYAHRRGVLHRDIKPPNLILDPVGNIWITDFGLAKFEEAEDLSHSQDVIGTLRYMAPERFRGVSTARCDVYALGATLYEMIALRPPFQGKDQLQLIRQVENDPPIPPREIERRIPRDLETIVLKALAKSPEDRFGTAKEMADELRRFVDNRPIRSRPIPMYQRFWRWCKRDPGLAGASLTAAVLVVVLAVVSSLAAWSYRKQLKKVEASETHALAEYKKGQEKLFQAHYDRAQAQRLSRREGQRFQSLAAIEEAVRIGRELRLPSESFDRLRDEAIACMALPDLRPDGRVIPVPSAINAFAFDPTMTRYALRFLDGRISIRQVAGDREIDSFRARGDRDIWIFQFSPDGRYLATAHYPEGALIVRDIEGRATSLDGARPANPYAARFSPDRRRIAASHHDGELVTYSLPSGRPITSWRMSNSHDLAFRQDGAQIAVTCNEGKPTCRILDAKTGDLVRSMILPSRGYSVAWSPDGTTLATACDDGMTYLWDAASGTRKATLQGPITAGVITAGGRAAFHPAGTLLASNDWSNELRLWDSTVGRPWLTFSGQTNPEFSRDGRIVVMRDSQLVPYLADPALEFRTFSHPSEQALKYDRPSIHRDGRLLAFGTERGTALWDLARGMELAFLPIGQFSCPLFEPSGDLITGGLNGGQRWPIRLDPARGELHIGPPRRLRDFPPSDCIFEEDQSGRILALAHHGDAHVLTRERTFSVGPLDDCRGVAVSPDGQWLATASHQVGGVRIWRIADATEAAKLPIEGGTFGGFSPDGNWLVAGSPGCRLWKVGTWEEAQRFGGMYRAFSPDSRQVVVQDSDKVLHLVEVENGRTLARFASPYPSNVRATFSPDGSRLVVTDDGVGMHVWDLRRIRHRLAGMGLDWDAPPDPETDPAAETSPGFSNIVVDLGPFKPELQSLLAQARQLEESGNIGGAIDRFRQAVRVSPNHATVQNNLAWLLVTAPRAQRNFDEALQHARRAVELEPGEQVSLNTLGVTLYRTGRFAEAIETLEKSLVAGKGQLAAFDLFFLAMAHHRSGHVDQARARLDQARNWMEAHRKTLQSGHLKELTDFRAEAEAVLAGASADWPDDVFAGPG